jgi:hypothetical protein
MAMAVILPGARKRGQSTCNQPPPRLAGAVFRALQIGTHTFDTNIHFGLDRNEGLDALTRINSALASANDALTRPSGGSV